MFKLRFCPRAPLALALLPGPSFVCLPLLRKKKRTNVIRSKRERAEGKCEKGRGDEERETFLSYFLCFFFIFSSFIMSHTQKGVGGGGARESGYLSLSLSLPLSFSFRSFEAETKTSLEQNKKDKRHRALLLKNIASDILFSFSSSIVFFFLF